MKRIIVTTSLISAAFFATAALAETPAQSATAKPGSSEPSAAQPYTPQSAGNPSAASEPADIPAEGSSAKHHASHAGRVDIATGKQVQSALKSEGLYDGPVNGRIGKQTRTAIAQYQKKEGFPATAQLDKKTLDSLKSRAASASGSGSSSENTGGAASSDAAQHGENKPAIPQGAAH